MSDGLAMFLAVLIWSAGSLVAWIACVYAVRFVRWVYSGWQARKATESAYDRVRARQKRSKRSEHRSGMLR